MEEVNNNILHFQNTYLLSKLNLTSNSIKEKGRDHYLRLINDELSLKMVTWLLQVHPAGK